MTRFDGRVGPGSARDGARLDPRGQTGESRVRPDRASGTGVCGRRRGAGLFASRLKVPRKPRRPLPEAYKTLLWNVPERDEILFMRTGPAEAAWQMLLPVLEAWGTTQPSDFPDYAAGRWGPENTQGLLPPGHRWPLPTELKKPLQKARSTAPAKHIR